MPSYRENSRITFKLPACKITQTHKRARFVSNQLTSLESKVPAEETLQLPAREDWQGQAGLTIQCAAPEAFFSPSVRRREGCVEEKLVLTDHSGLQSSEPSYD